MGVQIKLHGVLSSNPNLPVIPEFGFSDDFARADATALGTTLSGKPWVVAPAATVQGITGQQAWVARSGALGPTFGAVDANASDGTVEVEITSHTGGTTGLALRVADISNYLRFTRSSTQWRLEKTVAGSLTVVWSVTAAAPVAPIKMKAVMAGTSIQLYADGILLNTLTVEELTGNTKHGIYNAGDANTRFDNIKFTA